jgi:hypothetical protein
LVMTRKKRKYSLCYAVVGAQSCDSGIFGYHK